MGGTGSSDKPLEMHSVAMGGLAILAYAGGGNSQKHGAFRPSIQRWLNITCATLDESRKVGKPGAFCQIGSELPIVTMAKKKVAGTPWAAIVTTPDDKIDQTATGHPMYQHEIMTLALNEIYGISQDKTLKEYCVDATQALLAARCAGNGAWKYDYSKGDWKNYSGGRGEGGSDCGDLSSGTWAVMALKAAKAVKVLPEAALRVGVTEEQVFKDLKSMVERMRDGETAFYYDNPSSKRGSGAPLGMASLAFLYKGKEKQAKMKPYLDTLSKSLCLECDDPATACGALQSYDWGHCYWGEKKEAASGSEESRAKDYYMMYYTTLALFQYGGEIWEKYNKANVEWLLKNQRRGKASCDDGSWETDRLHNSKSGETWKACQSRVFATALNVLQLQVYYRYQRDAESKATGH